MKVIAQSTAITKLPYFHLAYTAANNFKTLTTKYSGFTGGLILLIAIIVSVKTVKSSLNVWLRSAVILSVVAGLLVFFLNSYELDMVYFPSHSIISMNDSFKKYAADNDGLLPDAETWCDDLILCGCAGPESFLFEGGDVLNGESAFAFNSNLSGKKLSDIPPDTVLLFETGLGHDPENRKTTVASRTFFDDAFKKSTSVGYYMRIKISETRWNQSGGPEILTKRYNDGKGCDILFADGHVEYVPAKKIKDLKW